MGTYYFLVNETKKEQVHLDNNVKEYPMRHNEAIHFAIINYMMDNQGDELRLYSDATDNVYRDDLREVDLIKYAFDKEIKQEMLKKLKEVENSTVRCI